MITGQRLIGVNEVGETDAAASPADTTWGRTQQEGALLQLSVTKQTLLSAQAKMAEDTHVSSVEMSVQFNLIFSELEKIQLAFGIPAAQITGDLSDPSPTEEVLTIDQDSLASVTKGIYILGPGPASTRRVEAPVASFADAGDLAFGDTQWTLPQVTWDIENTDDGTGVLAITDAT